MDVAYAPGSLVTARGREWVVLPDSEPDLLVLRPLGGSDDEIAAVFPDLEPVDQARFPAPSPDDLGDARAAGLLRTALRIGFRSSAGEHSTASPLASPWASSSEAISPDSTVLPMPTSSQIAMRTVSWRIAISSGTS